MTTTASVRADVHTGGMSDDEHDVEVPAKARRRQYSARCQLEVLGAYEKLDREGKCAPPPPMRSSA